MTEEEVLAKVADMGATEGNFLFGEGDDREAWRVGPGYAMLIFPSPRQQRLEREPMQWEVDAIGKRGKVTETVYDASPDVPDKLEKAIVWFQAHLDSIPPKLRKKATVNFATSYSYGESYANIEITYQRPETNEEWTKRKNDLAERIEYHTAKRREEFERLKSEFEGAQFRAPWHLGKHEQ